PGRAPCRPGCGRAGGYRSAAARLSPAFRSAQGDPWRLRSLDLDHTLAAGIELVHQGLAALQRCPLVDVALVRDFVAVDGWWLANPQRGLDAHGRALALGIELG